MTGKGKRDRDDVVVIGAECPGGVGLADVVGGELLNEPPQTVCLDAGFGGKAQVSELRCCMR